MFLFFNEYVFFFFFLEKYGYYKILSFGPQQTKFVFSKLCMYLLVLEVVIY